MTLSSIKQFNEEKQRKLNIVLHELKNMYNVSNNTIQIGDSIISIDVSSNDKYKLIVTKNGTKEYHYMLFISKENIIAVA